MPPRASCPYSPWSNCLILLQSALHFPLIGETWRIVAKHPLESKYGLGASELLDAIDRRFRLKVALEGAVAEVQMAKKIAPLVGSLVDRFEIHDLDGYPDFSLWLPGREEPLFAECKNVRESAKAGGEAYREPPPVVCWLS